MQWKTTWHWLLWSRWQGNELCTCNTSIIPFVTPTCCAVGFPSTQKKRRRRRKTLSKQSWGAGLHQPGTLHVSCNTVAETHLPELSQPNTANFFHLSIETIFHSWHLCWLSILSVNWISDPPPSRFSLSHIESTNKTEPAASKEESCGAANYIFVPPSQLKDILLIINKHEAERSHSDIWRCFEKGVYFFVIMISNCRYCVCSKR